MLHAQSITLPLYPKKDPVTTICPPPAAMQDMLNVLRLNG